jgi:hypothetical protein
VEEVGGLAANEATTGFGVHLKGPGGGRPEPILSASACEPFREAIQLRLSQGRNAMAIWQDLVADSGFSKHARACSYTSNRNAIRCMP